MMQKEDWVDNYQASYQNNGQIASRATKTSPDKHYERSPDILVPDLDDIENITGSDWSIF